MRNFVKEGLTVRGDRGFTLRVLALAAAGLALLIADVLLLTLLVLPMAASARRAPSDLPQDPQLALLLPTRDPRTPWPTRTPLPTATQRPALSRTPELPPATSLPTGSPVAIPGAVVEADTPEPAESTPLPGSTPALEPAPPARPASSVLVTTPTASLQTATGLSVRPSGTAVASTPPAPIETWAGGSDETPSPVPGNTPDNSATQTPLPPVSLDTLGDLPDLEAYLRQHRRAIAGQVLEIVSLTMDATDAAIPRFVLQVAGSEGGDVLAVQPAGPLLEYGYGLLEDAKRYLGNADCAVAVESTYQTSANEACSRATPWCRVGPFDEAANSWTVTWTYVRGAFSGGLDTVEAWNSGP